MIRLFPSAAIVIAMTMTGPAAGLAQTPAASSEIIPTFRAEIWADAASEFMLRVHAYSELRRRLESALPEVTITDDVRRLRRDRRWLAQAIRNARPGAVQGEFFTAPTSARFALVLTRTMDPTMCAVVMDDNPGAFGHAIDGDYPDGKTFSTMPGVLLARLPELPDDIEFRFIGRHLILYDVRANTIIDRMPDAVRCRTAR
jgi:hypothetical protein